MCKWVVCCVALVAATVSAAIPANERDALIAFYNATGGAEWSERTNWLGAAGSECTWFGVTCNEAQTSVVELDLGGNALRGTFPIAALRGLPSLRELWLSQNELTGPLQPEIRDLRTLQLLDLGDNPIGGTIPPQIAEMPNLTALGLYEAELTGEIPIELWRMSALVELWLSRNELTGSIPSQVSALRNIEYLSIEENQLSGAIPLELTTLTNLVQLWLGFNEFEGSIPPQLAQLQRLELLTLWGNRFSGTIPRELAQLENLQYLFLSYNELTGPIPPELGSMPELLRLSVGSNELTGPIPASIGNLTKLQELDLDSNRLTGSIPPAIGNLSELTYLAIGSNDLSGPIPPSLWDLTKLVSLRMGLTRLTGSLPPAVGNLTNLELLTIHFTSMSGPLPPEIGRLEKLQHLFLARSGLTGRIPPELGNLRNLQVLIAWDNHLEGSLPPEIGRLENIEDLDLSSNRLSGPIPRELGNLVTLTNLELDQNALRGAIPFEITQLVNLRDGGGLMTGENALVIDDPAVRDFVARKDLFGLDTQQTVTPADVHVVETTDRSAEIGWTRIRHFGPGGYQVAARLTPGGPPVSVTTTEYLFEESAVVRNLQPQTTYFFTVAAVSLPSYTQKNLIISDPSPARTATTGPRVLAGPDVQVTEAPKGLIQIDEVPRNEDQFTLTNFGDLPTTVTFDFQENFATFEPAGFRLEGGASQIVRVRSVPQPPGYYYGSLWTYGEGANNLIGISLLSAARPPGIVRAEALDSRVDVAGEPGSDSVGQARFRNVGTAPLTGILVSDQPWVVPDDSRVFIFPGSVGAATFRVIRSRRPPEAEGALVATLSLVYVDGSEFGFVRAKADSPSGISVTKVTVVDVSRPATSASTIPPPGGVAFFVPGVTNFLRNQTSFFSDVSLLNNGRGSPVSDLRIYFTPASTQLTRVATLSPVPATTSVTLANILTTVYESAGGAGSLQIRSANWQNVVVQAKLIGLSERGSVSGEVPVFRSDRSVLAGDRFYLTGLEEGADVYLQETLGSRADVSLRWLDSEGRAVGEDRTAAVDPWSVAELTGAVPAGAATAVVTNDGPGSIAAYARVFDDASSDHWSVVDWSRIHAYKLGEVLRVPFVSDVSQPPGDGRRRAVAHGAGSGSSAELVLFNPSEEDVAARIEVLDANGTVRHREEMVVGPSRTRSANIAGAQALITPLNRGELVVTARAAHTAVPIVVASEGLRLGRARIFSNLDDSTGATVDAAVPGTYRTALGLVETGGAEVVVRARIYLDEGRGLATSVVYRDFTLSPGQHLMVDNLVRAIVGPTRETRLGELHNLQLRLEVISGSGAVLPFVVITDNGTTDTLLRLE